MINIKINVRKSRTKDIKNLYQQILILDSSTEEKFYLFLKKIEQMPEVLSLSDKQEIKKYIDDTNLSLLEKKQLKKDLSQKQTKQELTKILSIILLDFFYKCFEQVMSLILKFLRNHFKSFNKDKMLKIEEMLYNKDNKTLKERIEEKIAMYLKENLPILSLLYRLSLILETESLNFIPQIMKQKINIEYGEIIGEPTDCRGDCSDFCDGEVYPIDEIEYPPYHPGCKCMFVPYENEDVEGDI